MSGCLCMELTTKDLCVMVTCTLCLLKVCIHWRQGEFVHELSTDSMWCVAVVHLAWHSVLGDVYALLVEGVQALEMSQCLCMELSTL